MTTEEVQYRRNTYRNQKREIIVHYLKYEKQSAFLMFAFLAKWFTYLCSPLRLLFYVDFPETHSHWWDIFCLFCGQHSSLVTRQLSRTIYSPKVSVSRLWEVVLGSRVEYRSSRASVVREWVSEWVPMSTDIAAFLVSGYSDLERVYLVFQVSVVGFECERLSEWVSEWVS
jgi:hypothetical protein